jgi:hypothetical protein
MSQSSENVKVIFFNSCSPRTQLIFFSSIASSILDLKHNIELSTHHVDTKSSLASLLYPVGEHIPGQKITEFEELFE